MLLVRHAAVDCQTVGKLKLRGLWVTPPMLYIIDSPMQSGINPVWVPGIIIFTMVFIIMFGMDEVLEHVMGIMMAGTWLITNVK